MLSRLRPMLDRITTPIAHELTLMEELVASESSCGLASADAVARHIWRGGGKRMRPALFLLASRALANGTFDANRSELVKIAAAIELLHVASLLHDDVVDESEERHGRPSANASFGNRTSVLVGDLLWCRASDLVVGTGKQRLLGVLVGAAREMTLGEIMESTEGTTRESYMSMIERKTASLFSAAGSSAAIALGAGRSAERVLAEYGRNLGVAFQIADDVMDMAHDRRVGNPIPGVRILGGRGLALDLAREHAEAAKARLSQLSMGREADSLAELADYAVARTI